MAAKPVFNPPSSLTACKCKIMQIFTPIEMRSTAKGAYQAISRTCHFSRAFVLWTSKKQEVSIAHFPQHQEAFSGCLFLSPLPVFGRPWKQCVVLISSITQVFGQACCSDSLVRRIFRQLQEWVSSKEFKVGWRWIADPYKETQKVPGFIKAIEDQEEK